MALFKDRDGLNMKVCNSKKDCDSATKLCVANRCVDKMYLLKTLSSHRNMIKSCPDVNSIKQWWQKKQEQMQESRFNQVIERSKKGNGSNRLKYFRDKVRGKKESESPFSKVIAQSQQATNDASSSLLMQLRDFAPWS